MLGKRRLPGSVMAEDRDKRSLGHIDVHSVHRALRSDHIAFLIPLVVFIYQFFGMYHILCHLHTLF